MFTYVGGFISRRGLSDAVFSSHLFTVCSALIGSLPGELENFSTFLWPCVKDVALSFGVANLSGGTRAARSEPTFGGSSTEYVYLLSTRGTFFSLSFWLFLRLLGSYLFY
jgi:hypothetical protein